jgi:hypothetical protein
MKDSFSEYEKLRTAAVDAKVACRHAKHNGLDQFTQIRMLRTVFGLTLVEAKEVSLMADGTSISLSESQKKLLPSLKAALESK